SQRQRDVKGPVDVISKGFVGRRRDGMAEATHMLYLNTERRPSSVPHDGVFKTWVIEVDYTMA
ncbi:hypothetical protein Bpfe_014788, partial [Biomphalaria pfeifferi]